VKVLIVDDSALMRAVLKDFFASTSFEVVGEAGNGRLAVELNESLRPDLVTMDLDMPVMNGMDAIDEMMKTRPVAIVVFSTDVAEDTAAAARRLGAVDVIEKPVIDRFYNEEFTASLLKTFERAVAPRWAAPSGAAGAPSPRAAGAPSGAPPGSAATTSASSIPAAAPFPAPGRIEAIVLGASTGGPVAVKTILAALPADFPVGIAVVQHIEPRFAEGYARWLDGECALSVRLARGGESFAPGSVVVAPGDVHLVTSRGVLTLDDGPKVGSHRPAVDRLFETAAADFGPRLLGVLLTGMGRDGASGCVRIRERGGYTIVQDEESSFIYGMPRAAAEAGGASEVRSLAEIASRITEATRRA
jgi:two-component system chemotaxis response regulator CheB